MGKKLVRAPFIPRIADELDVSNFAEEFTGMAATDSPAIVPANVDKIFKVLLQLIILKNRVQCLTLSIV